jgi:hypothetical protein
VLTLALVKRSTPLPTGSGGSNAQPATGTVVLSVPAVRHDGYPGVFVLSATSGEDVVAPLKGSDRSC